ncbi:hypothetical protein ABVS_0742 [Acinetobacter lwoffii]|nr:hypothetical protein ABVS_0742 [Acinetobacter lwoffii]
MQDYKVLQNYIDEEIIYEGKNYNLSLYTTKIDNSLK